MKRFSRALLCAAAFAPSLFAEQVDARDLTVRLFSTAPMHSFTIEASRGATMRRCARCNDTPVVSGLQITEGKMGSTVMVGDQPVPFVRLTGELRLRTAERSAAAAGKWLVQSERDGLHVLLTLPSERYVMAVLQSEAGADDGPEALKALAVVARSFALTHPDRHGVEGLCDSTHCQVARMGAVPAKIRDAVMATAGETLWFSGRQVDGYFTQNCGGNADDASDIWGGARKPWLRAHHDPFCQKQPAQWHASIAADEFAQAVSAEGYRVEPRVTGVRVLSNDSSGRATRLAVSANGKDIVVPASALRFAVNRELGWNRLRSDWYSVHLNGRDVVFDGRGYGHGVGLCQAGAAVMAQAGKSYREILAFYFAGTQVQVGAHDAGWQQEQGRGWTLRSVHADPELKRAANEAWELARQKWGSLTSVHPTLTVAPDTELFRQMTNEPGWALASTSGTQVTLQSLTVVRAHGALKDLLLHEFLHAIAESQSAASAQLWLREGLVELLAGEKSRQSAMSPEQTERALAAAKSLREAQTAHAAAEALVQSLVAKYGLANVRGWLHTGVPAGVLAGK